MKKHMSIFGLIARHSLNTVLGILVLMAAVQVGAYYVQDAGLQPSLVDCLDEIPSFWVILAGTTMIYAILCGALSDRGGKLGNFLNRLDISEKAVFAWQAVYNCLVLILVFLVQGLVYILLGLLYTAENPGTDPMSIFFASYRDGYFHLYFPLEDPAVWIAGGIGILGMGLCSAVYPLSQRHRKTSIKSFLMIGNWAFYFFISGEDRFALEYPFIYAGVSLLYICAALYTGCTMEVDEDGSL